MSGLNDPRLHPKFDVPAEPKSTEVPDSYHAIAQLVSGYVDDRLGEFRAEMVEVLNRLGDMLGTHSSYISQLQANAGGMRDAIAELQSSESMPEHVYKQFIRAEAERLRLIKPVRTPNPPSSTPDPDTSL